MVQSGDIHRWDQGLILRLPLCGGDLALLMHCDHRFRTRLPSGACTHTVSHCFLQCPLSLTVENPCPAFFAMIPGPFPHHLLHVGSLCTPLLSPLESPPLLGVKVKDEADGGLKLDEEQGL